MYIQLDSVSQMTEYIHLEIKNDGVYVKTSAFVEVKKVKITK